MTKQIWLHRYDYVYRKLCMLIKKQLLGAIKCIKAPTKTGTPIFQKICPEGSPEGNAEPITGAIKCIKAQRQLKHL